MVRLVAPVFSAPCSSESISPRTFAVPSSLLMSAGRCLSTAPVSVHLNELRSLTPDTLSSVGAAFCGRSGYGALSVRIPGFDRVRRDVLFAGARLAIDPAGEKMRRSCRARNRVAPGWSGTPGSETHPLQSGFYANLMEEFKGGQGIDASDLVFGSNVWPTSPHDDGFQRSVVEAGRTMQEVGLLALTAARAAATEGTNAVDKSAKDNSCPAIPDLRALAEASSFLPARLAYYDANFSREDGILGCGQYWLPWHVDFNIATVLMSAIWIDQDRALSEEWKGTKVGIDPWMHDPGRNPEKDAGLLLRNSQGDIVPAALDEDCVLVQLGAHAQIASGGLLRAGPHAVGNLEKDQDDSHYVSSFGRMTFGVFIYGPWSESVLPSVEAQADNERLLADDFGGLMRKAYTGETVKDGFQKFADHMNTRT